MNIHVIILNSFQECEEPDFLTYLFGRKLNKIVKTPLKLGKGPKIKKRESMVFDHRGRGLAKTKSLFRFEERF